MDKFSSFKARNYVYVKSPGACTLVIGEGVRLVGGGFIQLSKGTV